MTHKIAKLLSVLAGALGIVAIFLLVGVVGGAILALFGVHLTGELTGRPLLYLEVIAGFVYILYYAGVAFFFGYRWPDVSWRWGLWMSGGFFILTLISWPVIQPIFRQAGVILANFYALLGLVFIWTIPSVILTSLGGYLGARCSKLRRLQKNNAPQATAI